MKLDEISKLLGEITQGVWVVDSIGLDAINIVSGEGTVIGDEGLYSETNKNFGKDALFIAAAPTIIRELVKRVRLLEDVLGRCESLADNGADDPAGPYNVLQQVVNTICTVLYAKEKDDA